MNTNDLVSVGKGALIAAAGAVLTYLGQWASNTDFGNMTPAIVAALSVGINAFRKYLLPTPDGGTDV